jgi:hypothetical protein
MNDSFNKALMILLLIIVSWTIVIKIVPLLDLAKWISTDENNRYSLINNIK